MHLCPAISLSGALGRTQPPRRPLLAKPLRITHVLPPARVASVAPSGKAAEPLQDKHRRAHRELLEASKRHKGAMTAEDLAAAMATFEKLLPDTIDLFRLNARQWLDILGDVNTVPIKVFSIMAHFPAVNAHAVFQRCPRLLLRSPAWLEDNAKQARQLLASAKDPDRLVSLVPDLLDAQLASRVLGELQAARAGTCATAGTSAVAALEANPRLVVGDGLLASELVQDYSEAFKDTD